MKNRIVLVGMLLICAMALLTGCMSANRTNDMAKQPTASSVPFVNADPQPATTPAPTENAMTGASGEQSAQNAQGGEDTAEPFAWANNTAQVTERINQFSEIANSSVVVDGNTALVGVEFDPQYKGELTERIRQMIAGVVMSYDAQVQTVAVTAEGEDMKSIGELAEMMISGDMSAVKTEMDKIIRNTTTLS